MKFLEPARLILLVAVAAMAAVWILSLFRKRKDTIKFTNVELLDVIAPDRLKGARRHLPVLLTLVALTLLVIGIAKPARTEPAEVQAATVVLALDMSDSMNKDDIKPSRLEAAKKASMKFIDELPAGISVGLVKYSGESTAVSNDVQMVKKAISDAKTSDGRATGDAVHDGIQLVTSAPRGSGGTAVQGHLVVLTDGDVSAGRSIADASKEAVGADTPVDVVVLGKVDEKPLQELASQTRGKLYHADSEEQLLQAFDDVEKVVSETTKEKDISRYFLVTGLILLIAAAVLGLLWSGRIA